MLLVTLNVSATVSPGMTGCCSDVICTCCASGPADVDRIAIMPGSMVTLVGPADADGDPDGDAPVGPLGVDGADVGTGVALDVGGLLGMLFADWMSGVPPDRLIEPSWVTS